MRVTVRQMQPDDAAMHRDFIAGLDPGDLRFRFGSRIDEVPPAKLRSVTKVDHEREATLVAIATTGAEDPEIVGEIRIQDDIDAPRSEFAIAVRSDRQRRGLGRRLLESAIAFCRARGVRLLYGLVDPSNAAMIGLARRLGFDVEDKTGAKVVVSLEL